MSLRVVLAACILLAATSAGCFGGGDKKDGTLPTPAGSRSPGTSAGSPTPTATATPPATGSPTPSPTPTTTTGTTPPPTTPPATSPATPDTSPPYVDNLTVSDRQGNQVRIEWDAFDPSAPISCRVEYGRETLPPFSFQTSPHQAPAGRMEAVLSNLLSNTEYRYRVLCSDGASNQAASPVASFTTLLVTPDITALQVKDLRNDRFTVQWMQGGSNEVVSQVRWGTSSQYGLPVQPVQLAGPGLKSYTITGLQEGTTYHFIVDASSPSGTRTSGDQVQKTAILVEIGITSVSGVGRFNPNAAFTAAGDTVLVKVTYNAGSSGGVHSWELRNGTGGVVPGFQSPDLSTPNQVWESGPRTLTQGTYSMRDRSDSGATGVWTVSS